MNLFAKDFWLEDKNLAKKLQNVSLDKISSIIPKLILENAPQTIPFEIRAKIFKYNLELEA